MEDREPQPGLLRALVTAAVLIAVAVGGRLLAEAVADGTHDSPSPLPFALIAAASLLLLALTRRAELPTPAPPDPTELPPSQRLAAAVFAVITTVLTAAVLVRIPTLGQSDSFTLVVVGWIAAVVTWFTAIWLLAPPAPAQRQRPPNAVATALAVTAIVAVALALRLIALDHIPFTLGGDEASQGLEAIKVLDGRLRNPFSTSWYSVPTMSFFFQSLWFRVVGATLFGLRLPWALVGTTAVLVAFFLVRRLTGTAMALATSFAVATYHFHIHYSRLGSNQIADTLIVGAVLLFVVRGLDGTRWRFLDWAAAGGLCAAAFAWYAGARLAAVLAIAVVVFAFLVEPRRFARRHGDGIAVGLLSFLVVGAPMLQYAVRFPNEFSGRINQVGIFQSGWLTAEVGITGQSMGAILFDQFRRAALAFNYYPDRRVWYGLETPLLDPVFGTVFLVGAFYGLAAIFSRRGQTRMAPLVAWWWGGMILGGMLTESPPSSQRLITLAIPTCFFIVLGLTRLLEAVRGAAVRRLPVEATVLILVSIFAIFSIRTYFVDYTPHRIYGGPHAELATVLAPTLTAMRDSHRVVFLGPPHMYWGFATIRYLAPGVSGEDIPEPLTEPPPESWCRDNRDLLVVAVPPRTNEIGLVQRTFPNGTLRMIESEGDRHGLLAITYQVPCRRTGSRYDTEGTAATD